MANPNLGKGPRAPRKPVAAKEQFMEAFVQFAEEQGLQFRVQGRTIHNKASLWHFYRDLKKFESAFTAAVQQASLSGIGRYRVTQSKRQGHERPVFRFFQSSAIDRFFIENQGLVSKERVTDPAKIKKVTLRILHKLQDIEKENYSRQPKATDFDNESDTAIADPPAGSGTEQVSV